MLRYIEIYIKKNPAANPHPNFGVYHCFLDGSLYSG